MGAIRWTPEQLGAHEARKAATAAASKKRIQALGRLKSGAMNKTEAMYAAQLETMKQSGLVEWYRFEGMKFRLADNTFYTPDFMVMMKDGTLEAHEIKGYWQDDARVKIKVAAEMYPFAFVALTPKAKKSGGGWEFERF